MPMSSASQQVREDCDRVAALSGESGNNEIHLPFLLRSLPPSLGYVLEIGCGTGALSRGLARMANRVVALDLSPEMIRLARDRTKSNQRIEYQVADLLDWLVQKDMFDCVVSVATLHHLCYEEVLPRIRQAVRPGGCFVALDLRRDEVPSDRVMSVLSFPMNIALRLASTGRFRPCASVRQAWERHGRSDRYLSYTEARRIFEHFLPGASVRRHFFWRYSVVWRKPCSVPD